MIRHEIVKKEMQYAGNVIKYETRDNHHEEFSKKRKKVFGSNEFTHDEQIRINNLLANKLNKDDLATRPGPYGAKLIYLESNKAIELANAAFGFNGWSCNVLECKEEYRNKSDDKKWSIAYSAIVRIKLRDGTTHEDVGFGQSNGQRDLSVAIENAKKSSISDARKRSLRLFGELLGNSCYDQKHVKDVHSNKAQPKNKNYGSPGSNGNEKKQFLVLNPPNQAESSASLAAYKKNVKNPAQDKESIQSRCESINKNFNLKSDRSDQQTDSNPLQIKIEHRGTTYQGPTNSDCNVKKEENYLQTSKPLMYDSMRNNASVKIISALHQKISNNQTSTMNSNINGYSKNRYIEHTTPKINLNHSNVLNAKNNNQIYRQEQNTGVRFDSKTLGNVQQSPGTNTIKREIIANETTHHQIGLHIPEKTSNPYHMYNSVRSIDANIKNTGVK